jgi:hypothetical protein
MKIRLKWVLAGAALAMATLQLTNPARTNPPIQPGRQLTDAAGPPSDMMRVLRAACYDCHSQETQWPWYSRVAPVSWLVVDHVNEGRRHLNFSDWPNDDPRRAAKYWNRVADQISSGDMPLPSYARIHSPARLTAEQRTALAAWAEQQARRLQTDAGGKD